MAKSKMVGLFSFLTILVYQIYGNNHSANNKGITEIYYEAERTAIQTVPAIDKVDISVIHRRGGETYKKWGNVNPNTDLHYIKHELFPYYRMYSITIHPPDTSGNIFLHAVTIKSFWENDTVRVQKWEFKEKSYSVSGLYNMDPQKGLLKKVDREEIILSIAYLTNENEVNFMDENLFTYNIILDKNYEDYEFE